MGEAILTPYKKFSKMPWELWISYQPNLKYLRVSGCLAKVMLLDHRKRKIGSKTSDCKILGYAKRSISHKFLIFKSDVTDRNIILEAKNVEFF